MENTVPNYSAPALEKGLAIIELLSTRTTPMTQTDIAAELGRSKAEIYRMLLTLEHKQFIRRDVTDSGYELTSRLFELGMRHPQRQHVIATALPHMRTLSRETGQSCHLTLVSADSIVAVARVESDTNAGFSVKVGFRASAVNASSGRVIYAFQTRAQQAVWLNWIRPRAPRKDLMAFVKGAQEARAQGYLIRESYYTLGVTDIVVPVLRDTTAVAALVVPFMDHRHNARGPQEVLQQTLEIARSISDQLTP